MEQLIRNLRHRIAEYTVDELSIESKEWETGVALLGLFTMDEYQEAIGRSVDRAVATQTSEGLLGYGWKGYPKGWMRNAGDDLDGYKPTVNSSILARGICEYLTLKDTERFYRALQAQYNFYERADRTADGAILRRLDAQEIFTESLYFLTPFLVRYGILVNEQEPIEEAVNQVDVHLEHLQDGRKGLFRHVWRECPDSYPSSYFWSRANGWAVAGLLDTMLLLPENHSFTSEIRHALEISLDAIVDLQDGSGYWHIILDDSRSRLESSGTLAFAYTLQRALNEDIFDKDSYENAAKTAMEVCLGGVNEDGGVQRVSKPPANASTPLGVTLYGQGLFLLASNQFV